MSDKTRYRLGTLIEILMDAYPDGITTTEAGVQLHVTRQTIHKDVQRLQNDNVPVLEVDANRYAINPRDYIRPLQLTMAQAWMLYLPLRRMVRAQMHDHYLVYTLLQKLTTALDPQIGDHLIPAQHDADKGHSDVLRQLVEGWQNNQCVAISYRPLNKPVSRHLIAPYWFEPAVWSDSLYVIAGFYDGNMTGQTVTLKLDRIETASLRSTLFEPLSPPSILAYLASTWGIWGSEEPRLVRLKFVNRQRQRLLETHWHPSEKMTEEPDGSIIWEAMIGEPQEMLPWIRGWGPDVEVLEPLSIRQQIAMDADRTAHIYDLEDEYRTRSFLSMRKPKQ